MDIITALFGTLVFALLGVMVGLMAVEIGRLTSPTRLKVSVLVGVLGVLLLGWGLGVLSGQETVGTIGGIICASACALTAGFLSARLEDQIRRLVHMAPHVQAYTLDHFRELDFDGDGVITRADLEALAKCRSAEECELREHIANNLDEIGHVVDSYVSYGLVPIGGSVFPTTITHCRWGISREDLPTYPERVRAKYSSWL